MTTPPPTHPRRHRARTATALLTACVALTTVAGCSLAGGPAHANQSGCAAGTPTGTAASSTVIGVLAQTAASGRTPATDQARAEAVQRVNAAAGSQHARLIADRIDATAVSGPPAADIAFDGTGNNDLERATRQQCATRNASNALGELAASRTAGGTDVLAGLTAMSAHLNGMPRTTTEIVLLGNLAGRTGPLAAADPAQLTDPAATVEHLAVHGQLPDCRGWQVYVVGGGTGTGLDDEHLTALRELYRALFQRCGGRLVSWDSALVQFPNPEASVSPVAAPAHPITKPVTGGVLLTLSGSTFATGSAVLRSDSTAALTVVLRAATQHPRATVTVRGYTDSTPNPRSGGNTALAAARAAAVAGWLVDHGITRDRITHLGLGATDFIADNTTSDGRQANRRVEVLIHG